MDFTKGSCSYLFNMRWLIHTHDLMVWFVHLIHWKGSTSYVILTTYPCDIDSRGIDNETERNEVIILMPMLKHIKLQFSSVVWC